jgi:hypothetical protein
MTGRRLFALLFAIVGAAALALQFVLLQENAAAMGVGPVVATVNFFSYFTILSNLLATAALAAQALAGEGGGRNFLRRPSVATAIALYMSVTGAVYVTILRQLWAPVGLAWLADAALHYVMPLAYVGYWVVAVPKRDFGVRNVLLSLVFPLAYCAYALVRGGLTGFYPYPFLDASALGYPAVIVNAALLACGFGLVGGAVVVVGAMARR